MTHRVFRSGHPFQKLLSVPTDAHRTDCSTSVYCACVSCIACPRGRYGVNCESTCDCANGASCDSVTGACNCLSGWTGPKCLVAQGYLLIVVLSLSYYYSRPCIALTIELLYFTRVITARNERQWSAEGSVVGTVSLWFFCLCIKYIGNR